MSCSCKHHQKDPTHPYDVVLSRSLTEWARGSIELKDKFVHGGGCGGYAGNINGINRRLNGYGLEFKSRNLMPIVSRYSAIPLISPKLRYKDFCELLQRRVWSDRAYLRC